MIYTSYNHFGSVNSQVSFIKKRIYRIVPPYWLFTTLMVIATLAFPARLDTATFTVGHALLSYLFIPHIDPGRPGNINPIFGLGWTLMYEMYFYLVFAVALFFRRSIGIVTIVGLLLFFSILAQRETFSEAFNLFLGKLVVFEFVLGMVAYFVIRNRARLPDYAYYALVVLGPLVSIVSLTFDLSTNRLWTMGFPAFSLFLLLYYVDISHQALGKFVVLLGDASYIIYLSHPFTIEICKQIVRMLHIQSAGLFALAYMAVTLPACIIVAILIHRYMEKPTMRFLSKY